MSETTDIIGKINDLTIMFKEHVAETKSYRIEKDKRDSAMSDTVWDKDGKPGLATKVDRLVQIEENRKTEIPELVTKVDRLSEIEKNRKWTIRAIGTGLIGLIIQQIGNLFHK